MDFVLANSAYTDEMVLLQLLETQMKCRMKRFFALHRGLHYLYKLKRSSDKNYNLIPKICTMEYPKFIASNQKEESTSIQRFNICV